MGKFLKTSALFAIFAIMFYGVALPLWSSALPPFMAKNVRSCIGCYGHLYSRSRDIPNVNNPDILFLGSSHAYRGFDTRVFKKHGLNTFNLGSSSQTPINTNVLLKQYMDQINPKLVVYEVYAGTLQADGVESSLDMTSNNRIDLHTAEMAFNLNNLMTYNTFLFGLFRQIFNLNENFVEPQRQNEDFYIKGGGYVETAFRKNPLSEEKTRPWKLNPDQWTKLQENLQLLKDRKIPYVLVQTPISEKLYNARPNSREIDSKLSALGSYRNFYGDIKLNDTTDFYDSNHMNQQAVVKFNERLIQFLKERHFLK